MLSFAKHLNKWNDGAMHPVDFKTPLTIFKFPSKGRAAKPQENFIHF